jgi:uncharacterized membrane protein
MSSQSVARESAVREASIRGGAVAEVAPAAARVASIDAVRGLIMVIMALDHVRDFIHRGAMSASPTDLATTTPALFMTRWITHICAPVFMLTAGLGAFLWWRRGRTKGQLSLFLLTRGLWLMFLELTVMRLAYNFDFATSYPLLLIVLWVLGLCMVVLAGLVWLPVRVLAVVSILLIATHNLLDGVQPAQLGAAAPLWNLLHQPGAFPVGKALVFVAYPLVPWVAVMALGFSLGPLYQMEPSRRQRYLLRIGVAATVGFLVVRGLNVYGDPAPWSAQRSATYTLLSFLNTTKYPPSLEFLLMTLGPAFLALALAERLKLERTHPLVVFGRVPLFFFVTHFYAAHLAAALLALLQYGSAAWTFVFNPVPSMGGPAKLYPPAFGYDLWVAYAVWAAIVAGLYPLCRWFASVKARRRDWWLSYL